MKYRILLINWQDITNPLGGGAEVHAHEIFRRIAAQGHKVSLLCSGFNGAPKKENIDGIQIFRSGNRSMFNYSVPSAYYKLKQNQKFDIIIEDINKIPFYTPLYVKEPLVAIVHHLFGHSIFMEAPFPHAAYVYCAEKTIKAFYKKTRFITVSESTQKELESWNLKSLRKDIVYNGVDQRLFRQIPKLKSKNPLIGYFGRLKRYKCIEHIIQVFPEILKKVSNVQLLIVGDGDYRNDLEKLALRKGIRDRIHFTGSVKNQKKIDYLNRMWFAVNPSPKEGWGLTVIEANACGIPVIAADSPGLRDSVVHGKTGLLYPWGQHTKLKENILTMIENKRLRSRMGVQALQWSKRFSWDLSAKKILDIIEEVYHRGF